MYGKGRPLDSVSIVIRSQMQKKKIEDFSQFYQISAIFYPITVTEVTFREERVKKQQIWKVLQEKIAKNPEKNSGLKSFLDAPGKESPIHLCLPAE